MGSWIFATSLMFFLGVFWHKYTERGKEKKTIIIPTEFWFAVFCALLMALYITKIQEMFLFQASREKFLLIVSGIIGFLGILIHAIAKYLDVRHETSHWPAKVRLFITFVHFEVSHYLVYFSLCGVLFALSSAEDNRKLILLTDHPSTKVLISSGILFAFAFYKTILYGNTLPIETVIIPVITGVLFKNADLAITQTVFQYFSLMVLGLTSTALIYRNVVKKYVKVKLM